MRAEMRADRRGLFLAFLDLRAFLLARAATRFRACVTPLLAALRAAILLERREATFRAYPTEQR